MLKQKIQHFIEEALSELGIATPENIRSKITINYPETKLGDYASNVALILAKSAGISPKDLAAKIAEKIDKSIFESVEVAGAGFINFKLKTAELFKEERLEKNKSKDKILLEYFQPNIAKPLHIGHLRTAIIGDALKRMLLYMGYKVESDTHMGDWGTQFGILILAYKKYGDLKVIEKDPIAQLNKLYVQINQEIENDKSLHEQAKQEFVKLEQGNEDNKKIWKQFVDWSTEKFLKINDLMDILPFDHHWPESFYEDKMPAILDEMRKKGILVESQGAQIVNLEDQGLGVAVIVKSDGGTTYLLRDLATFAFVQKEGYKKHLYVVDNRQSQHYRQLFAILKMMGKMEEGEGIHINYGFISFAGEALSTRKGNMIVADEVIAQAQEKVAKIIEQKNPDLKNKSEVIKAVTKAALKYFDLKHNRHSDIEFNWDEALDFEGDSGPYLQYSYARLASILRKAQSEGKFTDTDISETERELLFKISILSEVVEDSIKDYLPNILANYLFNLAGLINRFYHESPVTQEPDEAKKNFRLALINKAKKTLGTGMNLLGIQALDEM